MADKKNLVILIPGFAKDETDTNCLPFQQAFVCQLKKLYPELQLTILAFQYPYISANYLFHSIPVISFGGKNKGGISKLLLRQKIYSKLKEINSTSAIKGILSFWHGECALIGSRFARHHSIKHYCWLMGQDARKGNGYVNKIKPSATEIIALSDFLKDEFYRNYNIRPNKVIPPGIDTNTAFDTTIERNIDLLAVGSLIPLKQFEIFIRIVGSVKKVFPQVKAVLIGDGIEKETLTVLITKQNLNSNIILTGVLPHAEVIKYMHRTKVFLHPSSYEGFGIVCIEALYAGADIVSFAKPMKENIPNWTNVSSEEAMAQKTIQLLQEKKTYQQTQPFTMERSIQQIMSLFIE